jgi:RimJ/RimL family protein N-acetyltransferase
MPEEPAILRAAPATKSSGHPDTPAKRQPAADQAAVKPASVRAAPDAESSILLAVMVSTERLILTPIGPEHTAELVELHADPNVAWWNAGIWSEADARRFATEMHRRWSQNGVGKWIAHRQSDGVLVGRGGLSLAVVDGVPRLELGWALRDEMRGQGFATEIGAAGLRFGFDTMGHHQIVAFTEVHNRASRAVMERLDMQFVKIIYAFGLVDGLDVVRDDAPFALYQIDR